MSAKLIFNKRFCDIVARKETRSGELENFDQIDDERYEKLVIPCLWS